MAFWDKWFGTSGKAKAAMAKAEAEAARARRIAEAALTPAEDSDQARTASERRLRRISGMKGLSGTSVGRRGGAGTNMLLGQ